VLSESFAYADSLSDLGMLELVGTPVAVNPDDDRYRHLVGKTVMLPLVRRL